MVVVAWLSLNSGIGCENRICCTLKVTENTEVLQLSDNKKRRRDEGIYEGAKSLELRSTMF